MIGRAICYNYNLFMKKGPFFSVIIPTLNEEMYLPKLLQVLSRQTCKDFEVIVVDADSSDQTMRVSQKHNSVLPIKFKTVKFQNVARQRNTGARLAGGKYLIFIDADVLFGQYYLACLKEKLITRQPDYATTRFMPDTNNLIDQLLAYMTNLGMILMFYLKKPFVGGQNMIFRKQAFINLGGFDQSLTLAEDHDLVQRAARKGLRGNYYLNLTHVSSFRRLEREGRMAIIAKYFYSSLYLLIKGPIRKPLYKYQMGGKTD